MWGWRPAPCPPLFPHVERRLDHARCLAVATGVVALMLLSTRKDPRQAQGHGGFLCPAGPSNMMLALKTDDQPCMAAGGASDASPEPFGPACVESGSLPDGFGDAGPRAPRVPRG